MNVMHLFKSVSLKNVGVSLVPRAGLSAPIFLPPNTSAIETFRRAKRISTTIPHAKKAALSLIQKIGLGAAQHQYPAQICCLQAWIMPNESSAKKYFTATWAAPTPVCSTLEKNLTVEQRPTLLNNKISINAPSTIIGYNAAKTGNPSLPIHKKIKLLFSPHYYHSSSFFYQTQK